MLQHGDKSKFKDFLSIGMNSGKETDENEDGIICKTRISQ
jgi:hypothetical protein